MIPEQRFRVHDRPPPRLFYPKHRARLTSICKPCRPDSLARPNTACTEYRQFQKPSKVSSLSRNSLPPSASVLAKTDAATRSSEKVRRLTVLIELRRLYRNLVRAQVLLSLPTPVYTPSGEPGVQDEGEGENISPEEDDARAAAINTIAEMVLTSDVLKACVRNLPSGTAAVFPFGSEAGNTQTVTTLAKQYSNELRARVAQEFPNLAKFCSEQALVAAIDARNARYTPSSRSSVELDDKPLTAIERLEAAEKVAERFVERKIKPVLRRARETALVDAVQESSRYLRGLWIRLNGGGGADSSMVLQRLGLPMPLSTADDSDEVTSSLSLELDHLESRLQLASKSRETKLRKAGIAGRVQMALQMKLLDAEVLRLSRVAAVMTLQLEMEFTYRSLEDEVLDFFMDVQPGVLPTREGTTDELALLAAEFALLDEQLMVLVSAMESDQLNLIGDDILERLAIEIPDLRTRVGVGDREVFGGKGFNLTKAKLQAKESLDKVSEAVGFAQRGIRLLISDIGVAARLFWRAARGLTLKPREVTSLRRTARDLLTFIPCIIILIIPLSPLGHVLVFSFIQRYFPSFFPSCFTGPRQEIMIRYEELRRQLVEAKAKVEREEEEEELERAAAAVARLTAPTSSSSVEPSARLNGTPDSRVEEDSTRTETVLQVAKLEAQLEEVMDQSMDVVDIEPLQSAENSTRRLKTR